MRILLDENFPPKVANDFVGCDCAHVISLGWSGILNGELLTRAEQAGFDLLVTLDTNIPDHRVVTARSRGTEFPKVAATKEQRPLDSPLLFRPGKRVAERLALAPSATLPQ